MRGRSPQAVVTQCIVGTRACKAQTLLALALRARPDGAQRLRWLAAHPFPPCPPLPPITRICLCGERAPPPRSTSSVPVLLCSPSDPQGRGRHDQGAPCRAERRGPLVHCQGKGRSTREAQRWPLLHGHAPCCQRAQPRPSPAPVPASFCSQWSEDFYIRWDKDESVDNYNGPPYTLVLRLYDHLRITRDSFLGQVRRFSACIAPVLAFAWRG